jgi:putative ABC transport system substrate-binding protein
VDFGNEHGLPVVAHTKGQIKLGALFLYADDSAVTGKIAASLADKIAKGANPGELPVEVSDLFLTVNMPTAETLGLEIPDAVLRSADEIMR